MNSWELREAMEYEDFSLRIEPKRGDVYPVSVLRSPAGEARSSFSLPFDPAQIADLLLQLGRTVRGSTESVKRHVSPAATRTALFPGPVRDLFLESRAMWSRLQEGAMRMKDATDIGPNLASNLFLVGFRQQRQACRKHSSQGLNGHLYQPNRRP